ncbi:MULTISPECIES: plasmid recombination protein [Gammaproteobacteria]|nr:plasmid recombination protein [Escherichia coli]MCV7785118.1 plasmid recombination protein [Escherichia coli]
MSASPEWWQTASADQQREFFKRSTEWLAACRKFRCSATAMN